MRHILSLLAMIGCFSLFSQVVTEEDISKMRKQIEMEAIDLKIRLKQQDFWLTEEDKNIYIEFSQDTFRIERLLAIRLEKELTDRDMSIAIYDAEVEYDKLLNKYYQLLLKKLGSQHQESLRKAQRLWIQFRDAEKELYYDIKFLKIDTPGTIENLLLASHSFDLTKARTVEIFNYLRQAE